jgi:hypothetical protein
MKKLSDIDKKRYFKKSSTSGSVARMIACAVFIFAAGYYFGKAKYIRAVLYGVLGCFTFFAIPYIDVINAVFFGINIVLFCLMHILNRFGIGGSFFNAIDKF